MFFRYSAIRWESCFQDTKKNQRTNKKHAYLKNKRFEHIKSSSSVLYLEVKRTVGTYISKPILLDIEKSDPKA